MIRPLKLKVDSKFWYAKTRWANRSDAEVMLGLDRDQSSHDAWSEQQLFDTLRQRNTMALVAEFTMRPTAKGPVCSFVVFELSDAHIDLLKLVVGSQHQRLGVGTAILSFVMQTYLSVRRRSRLRARVRESNCGRKSFCGRWKCRRSRFNETGFDRRSKTLTCSNTSKLDATPGTPMPPSKQVLSLAAAARRLGISRRILRALTTRKRYQPAFKRGLRQWHVNMSMLVELLRGDGIDAWSHSLNYTLMVVGAAGPWEREFAQCLPPYLRPQFAPSVFDAGVVYARDQPALAVIDCRIGRGEAEELGRRFEKQSLKTIGLIAEDETANASRSFTAVIKHPASPVAVRDAVIRLTEE